ncbi:hypothetical protein POPTR_018G128750v4 [Populus trichocarpa]|uniref:Uncharacterized protein n=1 Tax=Populus trichocarpa TaxID=3694 RepID=A0ACC0RNK8_POPTR|nr:hypothetical protein POPTR_018G128750v4 [Populus trichocarpa]
MDISSSYSYSCLCMTILNRFWGLQARHNIRWEKNWKGLAGGWSNQDSLLLTLSVYESSIAKTALLKRTNVIGTLS